MKLIATHILSSSAFLLMFSAVTSLTVTSTETALTSTVTHWVGIPCAVITPWTLSSWQHPLFLHFLREVLVGGAIGRNLAFHEQLYWPQLRFPKPLRRLRRLDLVSCPAYFSHAEGKNSQVNGLFCFCSKRHVGGAPIRLLHENDVTYCNEWRPVKAWQLKRYTRD